jgi:hypothetical protein
MTTHEVSAGSAARRTDGPGGANGTAASPAVDHSPGPSQYTITIPAVRLGHTTSVGGELLVDIVVTDAQMRRAGIEPGAGVERPVPVPPGGTARPPVPGYTPRCSTGCELP